MKRGFLGLVVSAVFVTSAGAVDVEHPFIQSFAHIPYVHSSVLQPGRWSGTLQFSYSNIWTAMSPKTSLADMEMGSLTLGAQYGLLPNLTGEVYLRGLRLQGGIFDGVIAIYAPSLPEVALGVGGIALALVLTVMALKVLPLLPRSLADNEGAKVSPGNA